MQRGVVTLQGKLFSKSFTLAEGKPVVVGRDVDADVQIVDASLSRHHCRFERVDGIVQITDLDSSNGTWVGGRRIKRHKLNSGEMVRLGSLEFAVSDFREAQRDSSHMMAALPRMQTAEMRTHLEFLFGVVRALTTALEMKDSYTRGHAERVTAYSTHLARAMGLSKKDIRVIELGALLHDIGKIGIPESVLHKPGRLTPEEYKIVQQHPQAGFDVLSQIEGQNIDSAVGYIVLHHHERWDGQGYPRKLAGEAIPLVARIVAMADAFDAMGSSRPYRPALGMAQVAEEVRCNIGKQFDPAIARICLDECAAGRMLVQKDMAANVTLLGAAKPQGSTTLSQC